MRFLKSCLEIQVPQTEILIKQIIIGIMMIGLSFDSVAVLNFKIMFSHLEHNFHHKYTYSF